MQVPKVFLETTIFTFYIADTAPDKRRDALKLFEEIKEGKYEPFTSPCVIAELEKDTEPKRNQMLKLIDKYNVKIIPSCAEEQQLADMYIAEGIIPPRYAIDAMHLACTTINGLDFIVSYNFKHLVKRKTVMKTEEVNLREGYNRIGIFAPIEVIEDE